MSNQPDDEPSSPSSEARLPESGFFYELNRRGVYGSVVAYLVVAWLIVEVASVVLPTFGAPETILRYLIIFLVAAFPIAMILAWFYDITLKGIVFTDKEDESRHPRLEQAAEKLISEETTQELIEQPDPDEADEKEQLEIGAERRLITVLQCSIGKLSSDDDQTEADLFRNEIPEIMARFSDIIERYEGFLVPVQGELMTAYFGVGLAHEDDTTRAFLSAQDMLAEIESFNSRQLKEDIKIAINVGLHCSFAIVEAATDKTVDHWISNMGHALRAVSALQTSASDNEIRISQDVYRMIQGRVHCISVGTMNLPGSKSPSEIYAVSADSTLIAVESKLQRSMIGRERELAILGGCWTGATQSIGQVVLLRGEAGIGKSRLVAAISEDIAEEMDVRIIRLQCSAYHTNSSLYPLIKQVQQEAFVESDSSSTKFEIFESFLQKHHLDVAALMPIFASLLSLESDTPESDLVPERQKEMLLDALLAILIEPADARPAFILIEDLHWADPTTLELLTMLIPQVTVENVMVLMTFRPSFKAPWSDFSHINQISINRLTNIQARDVVSSIDSEGVIEEPMVEAIIQKSDGVPLFLEEYSASALEFIENSDGSKIAELTIPSTLQESLAARLHHLGLAKSILHLGATIGREFSHQLILASSELSLQETNKHLSELVNRELIHKKGIGDGASYIFKHALIQEAAYTSMLESKREEYHHKVAVCLETGLSEGDEQNPEILAHHYSLAGDGPKRLASAIRYWLDAGAIAVKRSANLEAYELLNNALMHLKKLPPSTDRDITELQIQISRIPVLVALQGYSTEEMAQASERALELCESVTDIGLRFVSMYSVCVFYIVSGKHKAAYDIARKMEELVQNQDDGLKLEAYMVLGLSNFFLGDMHAADRYLNMCIDLYSRENHGDHAFLYGQDPEVIALAYLLWVNFSLGDFKRLQEYSERLQDRATSLDHPTSSSFYYIFSSWKMLNLDDSANIHEPLDKVLKITSEYRLGSFNHQSQILASLTAYFESGDESLLESIANSFVNFREDGSRCFLVCWETYFVRACIKAGKLDSATRLLVSIEAELEETHERWGEPELYRCKALLSQAQQDIDGAVNYWKKSIETAENNHLDGWGLRSASDLAELLQPGDRDQAVEVLTQAIAHIPEASRLMMPERTRQLADGLSIPV